MNPIIDPTTLTEEQRDAIKDKYQNQKSLYKRWHDEYERSGIDTMEWLFGKNFFKKGE